ncbi:conserved hypothetical protein [Methanococcus vannielii SB]|jgi:hypothetical protein|uniref:DUF2124 domain-containing protein n=1 Tax=Methanococcus vannielii (strain ATCC 35089 / DSM 1224 / JCM 13029 / OCM 148 / SB) TaxID=406327 RepID=A6USD7_METVS|nr:DUF2124 family protein [Methanococcus vannielii]ABR55409.1 conserved hypothetical protein [Methanococcus vannielii SB]
MKKIAEDKGISFQLRQFKSLVLEFKSDNILYTGSKGVCMPFALLNAYAVRNVSNQYFCADAKLEEISKLEQGSLGYTYNLVKYDFILNPDLLVLFGGIAMHHSKVTTKDVNTLIGELNPKKIVGVCFSSIFQKMNWDKEISFDMIIDSQLEPVEIYEKI